MPRRRIDATLPRQPSNTTPSSSSSNDVSPSILITVLILAIAVILFASLYLLLRFLRRNRHHTTTALPPSLLKITPELSSLPLFTFNRLTAKTAGDCAVCLSKFDNDDVLRLLPICCHAFHADCIDTWLSSNLTCPLCRSAIRLSDSELTGKITGERRSGSFRVEIGNVSNRNRDVTSTTNSSEVQRTYSLGADFDYVINAEDDAIAELSMTSLELRKEQLQEVATEEEMCTRGVGVGWLKDYLSSSSSRTTSFRNSGRLTTVVENELFEFDEVSRLGDEIGGFFKFFTGV